ncbi:MAG TPA: GPP34 family phosphoprotein [Actinocrinis sp.]|uniref:GOLPH3/VPS74 family protein n=1 Tax=Actinocrinis sp. TaxID=1920516 RepID=UPI002DDD10A7|nr:GPP34 family phosphoprotein [Actinocrinis sp.]HEV2345747.1 GPP34 family phosphoprotein [Actinocrinis sp.]
MTLAADLLLLAIDPQRRQLRVSERLDYALMGADLVELALARRVVMEGDRVLVLDARPTGDRLLDEALASIAAKDRPPRARAWVQAVRKGLRSDYLGVLTEQRAIRRTPRPFLRFFTVTDLVVLEPGRQAGIKARIDAVASGAAMDDPRGRALAGLAHAAGLSTVLYPGTANRALRKRLQQATRGERVGADVLRATAAISDLAVDATTRAVTDSAMRAATDAAVHAAMSAAVDAAHSAGHSSHSGGGHGGGGHH